MCFGVGGWITLGSGDAGPEGPPGMSTQVLGRVPNALVPTGNRGGSPGSEGYVPGAAWGPGQMSSSLGRLRRMLNTIDDRWYKSSLGPGGGPL